MSRREAPEPALFFDTRVPMAVWDQIVKVHGCWVWMGEHSNNGWARYRRQSAWRLLFHRLVGYEPQPFDQLDREAMPCKNPRGCVNPDHKVPLHQRPPYVYCCPTCFRPTVQPIDPKTGEYYKPSPPLAYSKDARTDIAKGGWFGRRTAPRVRAAQKAPEAEEPANYWTKGEEIE